MFVRDPEHRRVMDIVMLGPRGVGKTSLLASLYDRFPAVVGDSGLELMLTDKTTRSLVQDYRQELRRFAAGGPARDPGIAGSIVLRQFLIDVGTVGARRPQMTLRFTDFPGEALDRPDDPAQTKLDAILPTASVIFVVVDSPALLERDGFYNTEINKPDHVCEFVRDAIGASGPKLVVLVPLKCERYATTTEGLVRLSTAVRREYRTLIDGLGSHPAGQTGVVLTTVQTVGSMVFSRFEPAGNSVREVFRPIRPGAGYSPQDTDQPLRWMLRFAVHGFMARDKTVRERFSDWWNDVDVTFTEGIRSFGAGCREGDGFEVLCKHPYLELP
jgi:Double-GTPase 2